MKLTADFLSETVEARSQWDDIFQVLQEQRTVNQEFYTQQNHTSKMKAANSTNSKEQRMSALR